MNYLVMFSDPMDHHWMKCVHFAVTNTSRTPPLSTLGSMAYRQLAEELEQEGAPPRYEAEPLLAVQDGWLHWWDHSRFANPIGLAIDMPTRTPKIDATANGHVYRDLDRIRYLTFWSEAEFDPRKGLVMEGISSVTQSGGRHIRKIRHWGLAAVREKLENPIFVGMITTTPSAAVLVGYREFAQRVRDVQRKHLTNRSLSA